MGQMRAAEKKDQLQPPKLTNDDMADEYPSLMREGKKMKMKKKKMMKATADVTFAPFTPDDEEDEFKTEKHVERPGMIQMRAAEKKDQLQPPKLTNDDMADEYPSLMRDGKKMKMKKKKMMKATADVTFAPFTPDDEEDEFKTEKHV